MTDFECPMRRQGICFTFRRMGSVSDHPKTGVRECENCGLVTHEVSLRNFVHYETGSMNLRKNLNDKVIKNKHDEMYRRTNSIISHLKIDLNLTNVLDFGCNDGEFIDYLKSIIPNVFGLEIDVAAREKAIAKCLNVFESIESIGTSLKFEVLTLFHVIEHLYEPFELLTSLKSMLTSDGLLIIETPNSMDALLTYYKSEKFADFTYWSHHPMLYSIYALSRLLERAGFSIVSCDGVQRYSLDNHLK